MGEDSQGQNSETHLTLSLQGCQAKSPLLTPNKGTVFLLIHAWFRKPWQFGRHCPAFNSRSVILQMSLPFKPNLQKAGPSLIHFWMIPLLSLFKSSAANEGLGQLPKRTGALQSLSALTLLFSVYSCPPLPSSPLPSLLSAVFPITGYSCWVLLSALSIPVSHLFLFLSLLSFFFVMHLFLFFSLLITLLSLFH